jgi:hypothetical protein
LPPAKAVQNVSMEIVQVKDAPDSIYQQCETHFDAVWNKIKDSQ